MGDINVAALYRQGASGGGGGGASFAHDVASTVLGSDNSDVIDAAWRGADQAEAFGQVMASLGVTVTNTTSTAAFSDATDALAIASSEVGRDAVNNSPYLVSQLAQDQAIWDYCFIDFEKMYLRYTANFDEQLPNAEFRGTLGDLRVTDNGNRILAMESASSNWHVFRMPIKGEFQNLYHESTGSVSSGYDDAAFTPDGYALVCNDRSNTDSHLHFDLTIPYDLGSKPVSFTTTGRRYNSTYNYSMSIHAGGVYGIGASSTHFSIFRPEPSDPAAHTYSAYYSKPSDTGHGVCFNPSGTQVLMFRTSPDYDLMIWELDNPFSFQSRTEVAIPWTQQSGLYGADNMYCTPDGKHVYVHYNNAAYRYDMRVPGDFTTLYLPLGHRVPSDTIDATQSTGCEGVAFSPDGTRFYVANSVDDKIREFILNVAFNPNCGGTLNHALYVSGAAFHSIFWKPDGTKLYAFRDDTDTIDEYSVGTPWDLSTVNSTPTANSGTISSQMRDGFVISNDGTTFMFQNSSGYVYTRTFSPAWDITTASAPTTDLVLASPMTGRPGVSYSSNGRFALWATAQGASLFKLSTPFDPSTMEHIPNATIHGGKMSDYNPYLYETFTVLPDYSGVYVSAASYFWSIASSPRVYAP